MKINILDKKVYNRIAAGEVVERPYSVIKELVENSIDAGANEIKISIWNGGKDRIEIEDNGCGIEQSELPKVFMPHATSKICNVEDLDNILTLGFRGEALASIASVSKVKIVSKPAAQNFGATISSEGGVVSDPIEAASKNGTKITVDSLFFNTPVRAKFLKTSRAEESDITNIVGRLILANPEIAFKYYADDELVLRSFGGGLEESLISVYGIDAVHNCFKIETEKNGIKIKGYLGRHNYTKANRTYQTLILNGRYVINSTVSTAVHNAYQSYLMKRQYPFYVLMIEVPSSEVDVNVHPNKTDVRFSNNQVIYGSIYSVVSKVLDGTNEALDIIKSNGNSYYAPDGTVRSSDVDLVITKDSVHDYAYNKAPVPVKDGYFKEYKDDELAGPFVYFCDSGPESKDKKEEPVDNMFYENKKYIDRMEALKKAEKAAEERLVDAQTVIEKPISQAFISNKMMRKEGADSLQQEMGIEGQFEYIGQALKTYLIFQKNSDIYFVDQHAAHERLIFDELYSKASSGDVIRQPLLVPIVIELNSMENEYFLGRRRYIEEIGFTIEDFGGYSYKVTEVPIDVADINIKTFFDEALSDSILRQEKVPEVIRERLCQRACKAAIKAGDELDKSEIDALLAKLAGNMGLKCPHGRPIAIKITKMEIEKWFKRIV